MLNGNGILSELATSVKEQMSLEDKIKALVAIIAVAQSKLAILSSKARAAGMQVPAAAQAAGIAPAPMAAPGVPQGSMYTGAAPALTASPQERADFLNRQAMEAQAQAELAQREAYSPLGFESGGWGDYLVPDVIEAPLAGAGGFISNVGEGVGEFASGVWEGVESLWPFDAQVYDGNGQQLPLQPYVDPAGQVYVYANDTDDLVSAQQARYVLDSEGTVYDMFDVSGAGEVYDHLGPNDPDAQLEADERDF